MFNKTKKHLAIQMLASLEPRKLTELSENRALKTFHRAAAKIPAYTEFLTQNRTSPSSVRSIDDFKSLVPLTDKEKTFKMHTPAIEKLCLQGQLKDVQAIVSSSGYTGYFSYGLNTAKEIKKSQEAIDFVLDYVFEVRSKSTLLVNGLPMGVKIHSSLVTVVDTSVRADIIIGIIKTFARCFDQVILVGENSFVKKVLEDGLEAGVNWKKTKMNLVLGEEILPENLRTYFADILGINPDDASAPGIIGSSFGVAEIGLNVFYETRELIRIRRLMLRDKKLREKLIGHDTENLPALFHYNPIRVFVEEVPNDRKLSDMVLTNLEEDTNIPLVRYNIKDEGITISFNHLKEALFALGYSDYTPRIRLPLVAIWGRNKLLVDEGFYLRPEFIKELLYQDKTIACGITGNFRISKSKAGLRIEIQTKENHSGLDEDLENRIRILLLDHIPAKAEIIVYPYRDFPYGMELNYEKKFRYIE
ncbi:MAG: hypothetical protein V1863_02010 [Candidatus Omnitrophota bacterium]